MRARFCVGVALLLAAPAVWATTKGVKGIDIIVKKHPTGSAIAVRTDGGGTARFSLSEPGEYEIDFGAREAPPRPLAVAVSGEVRVRKAVTKEGIPQRATTETIALGRMTLDTDPDRVRLAYPRIDLATGIHTERITTFGPVDIMLRLIEDVPDPVAPAVKLNYGKIEWTAVESGPAPARQTVSVTSITGADWQIQFAPIDRISVSFSKPGGRLAPGASDTVDVTVQAVGLAPGVYKGQISILTSSGGQTGEPAYIPVYLRVFPRAQVLDPVVSRRTLVFADDTGTQSLEVTNPNAVPQTYLLEAADATAARAVRITPAQLVLQPGQSGRISVSFVGDTLGPFTLRLTPQGQPPVNIFARKVPPARAGCFPTELIPVLASVTPQIGENATGTVEAWDNCGRRVRDVVVKTETESGASFFGINDGIGGVNVGASKTPPGHIKAIAIAKDPFGGEITGSTGDTALGGRALPALADADKPFEIVEVVDAVTGEPGVVAPGALLTPRVITKSSSNIKNNFPAPVKELRGQSASIGERVLDIIGETEDGDPVVEVPTDLGPQFVTSIQSTKSGIKSQPLDIASAPAAPALLVRANPDGTPGTQAPIYKMNGEVREDYALGGGAPPRAGDIIQVKAVGLGATDADGNVLGAVKLIIGGVEAKLLRVGIRDDLDTKPGFFITAEMPEVKSLDGGAAPVTVKVVVDDIESAEAVTPPVEQVQTTKVKLRVQVVYHQTRNPGSSAPYQVDGVDYVGGFAGREFTVDKDSEVTLWAPPVFVESGSSPRYRHEFADWRYGTLSSPSTVSQANQLKVTVNGDTRAVLSYRSFHQHVINPGGGGITITPSSPDLFYAAWLPISVNGSCPQGQVLGGIEFRRTENNGIQMAPSTLYTLVPANALPVTFHNSWPVDLSVVCNAAANVSLTVTTNPAGLAVRIGTTGNFTPGPITQQVPANQAATVATQTPQTVNGTGYTFTGWSTGGAATITTVTPTANTTVTANFSVACHVLTINASGGTVTANPLGSVTGFQNNCYAPGTPVTLTATANSGNAFNGWSGDASGTTSPTTVTMTGPKSVTANFGAPGNVTLNLTTVPAGLNVRIGANTAFNPSPFSQQVPANQSTTIEAAPSQVLNGTGYRFANWSTGAATPATTVQPAANLTATATYTVACHTLAVNTTGPGTVTASPQSNVTGFASNCYAPGTTVVLTANPNTGSAFTSWSGDASGSTSPTSITMDAPKSVTASFGQAQNVTVTLATNPAGLGVRFGASGAFTPGPISQQFPASNNPQTIATQTPQVLNGSGYSFVNWSTGGATPVTTIATANTFTATANFTVACHTLNVNASGGTVTLNPAAGVTGFPNNCYAPGTVVTLTASPNTGNQFNGWSGDATGSAASVTVTMDAPKIVNATFGQVQNVTLNLITNPAGLLVQIGSGAFNPAPFSQQVPANQPQTIGTQAQQLRNGSGYSFTGWSTGATTPVTTVTPASNLAATANFTLACHVLGINVTGGGTVAANPASGVPGFPNNCYAPGTVVTLTANPNTGSQFNGWSGDATGTTSPTTVTMNAPKTVNAAFGAPTNVTLIVTTNPVGLNVRIGATGGFGTGPISQQVPANSTQTIATDSPQVVNGTGYRFTNWSTGAATPVTTVQPASNLTATANFQVACHLVNVTGTAGGTMALNPASGGITGFPANCFAPGSQVRILATADPGFGLRDVAINNGGSTSTVTTPNTLITVNGPVVAQATFIPRPATVSTIFPPVLVSGTTYRDNVFFSNPTPTPGNSLQITNVTFSTTGGTGNVTLNSTLPIVFGALPANGQSSTQQILLNIPATVTAYNIFVTVEVKNANGDTFTNVVSVGQTK